MRIGCRARLAHWAAPKARALREAEFGFRIAKEVSRLDIGQAVVVKNGTVLAVEAFGGTNDLMRRAGAGAGGAVAVKVSKPRKTCASTCR